MQTTTQHRSCETRLTTGFHCPICPSAHVLICRCNQWTGNSVSCPAKSPRTPEGPGSVDHNTASESCDGAGGCQPGLCAAAKLHSDPES